VRFDSLYRVLFLIYCLEAGVFLLFAPWSQAWDRLILLAPLGLFRSLLLAPWLRGLLTGFGVVHLLWVLHDVDLWARGVAPTDGETENPRGARG